MRDIKFRGKRLDNGEWVYGYLMDMHNDNRLFIGKWKNIGGEATIKDELFSSYVEVDPETVGQYTGLKDKNGVDIHEGDIVKQINLESTVRWIDGGFWLVDLENYGGRMNGKLEFARIHNVGTEVIGNIYENPELLKDGE